MGCLRRVDEPNIQGEQGMQIFIANKIINTRNNVPGINYFDDYAVIVSLKYEQQLQKIYSTD